MVNISVVMGVYNGATYLKEALESILEQTYRDFEFLIVDDASIDQTPHILREYAHFDNRIRIITNSNNLGLTKSLNKAIALSRGAYIARMDTDDVALRVRFERQIAFMEKHPEVGLLGSHAFVVDEKGRTIGVRSGPLEDKEIRYALRKNNPFIHSSVLIRREVGERVSWYDERIRRSQDYDLWLRISDVSMMGNLSEFLIKRRYTRENISVYAEREQIISRIKIRHRYFRTHHIPAWYYIFLLKPLLMLCAPAFLRNYVRKFLLKNTLRNTKNENFVSHNKS